MFRPVSIFLWNWTQYFRNLYILIQIFWDVFLILSVNKSIVVLRLVHQKFMGKPTTDHHTWCSSPKILFLTLGGMYYQANPLHSSEVFSSLTGISLRSFQSIDTQNNFFRIGLWSSTAYTKKMKGKCFAPFLSMLIHF